MIKVHISPWYDHADHGDGGIRRVVEAEIRHLKQFGIQPVRDINEADIIQNHGAMMEWKKNTPVVHTGHGLYWSRQPWDTGYQEVNEKVVESMCRSVAHTVPSEWVGRSVRRGGLFYPEVIYHGVDARDFSPAPAAADYVLWNKARADYVSDPADMQRVATLLPDVSFWTTVGRQTENVKVIGTMDYSHMKSVVAAANVYLCTVRETFGIGTLEAMACGVPVAGWDWGGQSEIIQQGETGYLAYPGDWAGLADCIRRCMAERKRLSDNCIQDIRTRWAWEPRIQQYADLFKRVYADFHSHPVKVSVLVTAYKLDAYLPQCLESVLKQNYQDWECVVVDDAQLESTRLIVEDFTRRDKRIRYAPTPWNMGLPDARNFGLSQAKGKYIRHLDADDFLAENALALEAEALDRDPAIHIAYGHLESVNEDGSRILEHGEPVRGNWPPERFEWLEQMAHLNQLPSCVMMRREVLTRAGGYRNRMKRQEDAEFWCRVTSLGFRAKKITQAVTYFHRQREDSKGNVEWKTAGPEPDWTAWFPWRVGAATYREAVDILRKNAGRHPAPYLVPFAAQGKSPVSYFWPVHDYAYPVVSIIVTCGPGHEDYLQDALDSIQAQSYPDWECVVVNDTGKAWDKYIPGAPWATVVNMQGNQGVAAARNAGVKYTHGRYIIWMDADDYWLAWYLQMMVAHAEKNDGIIYSDLIMDDGKSRKIYRYEEFNSLQSPFHMRYPGSSILVPRRVVQNVQEAYGGWDTQIPGMEDWDYQIQAHSLGFCAYHVPEALFVYRTYSSTKRERDYAKIDDIEAYLDVKWKRYRKEGEKLMCGCGQKTVVRTTPGTTGTSSGNAVDTTDTAGMVATQMVQVEYMGPLEQDFSIRSRIDPGISYRFGNNIYHKQRTVFLGDASYLTGIMDQDNRPMYKIVGTNVAMENRDPAAFLGQPVAA